SARRLRLPQAAWWRRGGAPWYESAGNAWSAALGYAGSRVRISDAFWPPKPKEFDITAVAFSGRALLPPPINWIVVARASSLMVGGIRWCSRVSSENTASTAPAAEMVWPTIDLFEDTGICLASSPNTAEIARYSILSFSGVAVPCALMWSIWPGSMPASASVLRTQPMIGLPSGLDRVRWNESVSSPQPATTPRIGAPRPTAAS